MTRRARLPLRARSAQRARARPPASQSFLRSFLDWLIPDATGSNANGAQRIAIPPRRMQISLAGKLIAYELTRARRKTVSMVIARDGLLVRAPLKIAQRDIDTILQERAAWIVQRLGEWQARAALIRADYRDGGSVLYRGQRVPLRVVQSLFESLEVSDDRIVIATPTPLTAAQQQQLVERWMRETAQAQFAPLVVAMAQHIGVAVKRVKLTDTKTMWGSCTSDGVVRLTFRLIQLPPSLAQYVIAHEISHRREMNHSPQFWEWVRVLDPHFKSHRRTLAAYTPLLEEGDV